MKYHAVLTPEHPRATFHFYEGETRTFNILAYPEGTGSTQIRRELIPSSRVQGSAWCTIRYRHKGDKAEQP